MMAPAFCYNFRDMLSPGDILGASRVYYIQLVDRLDIHVDLGEVPGV